MDQYLVFARTAYAEPLSYQGMLAAPTGQPPEQLALETYSGDWLELVLIPQQEVFWAIEEHPAHTLEVSNE